MFDRFQLAELHLKSVLAYKDTKTRKKAVLSLPPELDAAYETEMRRIKNSGKEDYKIAKHAFSWIYHARRPFLMGELREAITINPIENIEDADEECRELDQEGFHDPEVIIECCRSLIIWEISTDIVRFSHYTVEEFFKDKGSEHIESELYIGKVCLSYLCFDVFNEGPCGNANTLISRMQRYRLARYISCFCGTHILGSKMEKEVQDILLSILLSQARCQALHELIENSNSYDWERGQIWRFHKHGENFGGWNPLHFLAFWGLSATCQEVLALPTTDLVKYLTMVQQKWSQNTGMDRTISWSRKDFDPNVKDVKNCTPLYYAVDRGYSKIVKMLLDKGAESTTQGGHYGNLLQAAAARGHEDIVKMLLDEGVNVNLQGGYYGNALQAAATSGHEGVVRLLLDNGADVNVEGGSFGTPLRAALIGGHHVVVRLLLGKGADARLLTKIQVLTGVQPPAAKGMASTTLRRVLESGKKHSVEVLLVEDDGVVEGRAKTREELDQAIQTNESAVETTLDDHTNHVMDLSNLGIALQNRFERIGSMEDIIRAIMMDEQAVELTPVGHPARAKHLNNLATALFRRFINRGPRSCDHDE